MASGEGCGAIAAHRTAILGSQRCASCTFGSRCRERVRLSQIPAHRRAREPFHDAPLSKRRRTGGLGPCRVAYGEASLYEGLLRSAIGAGTLRYVWAPRTAAWSSRATLRKSVTRRRSASKSGHSTHEGGSASGFSVSEEDIDSEGESSNEHTR